MVKLKYFGLAAITAVGLSGCVSNQEPLSPGDEAARQASYLEFTKRQCSSVLGGSGVRDVTRASVALQRKAASFGVTRDYSQPDPGIATGWSFSVAMLGRMDACNQFVTDAYNLMAETDTL